MAIESAAGKSRIRIALPPPPRDHSRLWQLWDVRTMYLSGESILIILVVGLIAGWLAGKIVQGTGYGLIGDIVIGIIGAFIASWLFPRLGIALGAGLVREIIDATIGAILLLVILRLVRRGGRW